MIVCMWRVSAHYCTVFLLCVDNARTMHTDTAPYGSASEMRIDSERNVTSEYGTVVLATAQPYRSARAQSETQAYVALPTSQQPYVPGTQQYGSPAAHAAESTYDAVPFAGDTSRASLAVTGAFASLEMQRPAAGAHSNYGVRCCCRECVARNRCAHRCLQSTTPVVRSEYVSATGAQAFQVRVSHRTSTC
jgi:hypothetical protein